MSKAGLFLHTTINFDEVAAALDYGQRTLDHATYAKVTNAFKKKQNNRGRRDLS